MVSLDKALKEYRRRIDNLKLTRNKTPVLVRWTRRVLRLGKG